MRRLGTAGARALDNAAGGAPDRKADTGEVRIGYHDGTDLDVLGFAQTAAHHGRKAARDAVLVQRLFQHHTVHPGASEEALQGLADEVGAVCQLDHLQKGGIVGDDGIVGGADHQPVGQLFDRGQQSAVGARRALRVAPFGRRKPHQRQHLAFDPEGGGGGHKVSAAANQRRRRRRRTAARAGRKRQQGDRVVLALDCEGAGKCLAHQRPIRIKQAVGRRVGFDDPAGLGVNDQNGLAGNLKQQPIAEFGFAHLAIVALEGLLGAQQPLLKVRGPRMIAPDGDDAPVAVRAQRHVAHRHRGAAGQGVVDLAPTCGGAPGGFAQQLFDLGPAVGRDGVAQALAPPGINVGKGARLAARGQVLDHPVFVHQDRDVTGGSQDPHGEGAIHHPRTGRWHGGGRGCAGCLGPRAVSLPSVHAVPFVPPPALEAPSAGHCQRTGARHDLVHVRDLDLRPKPLANLCRPRDRRTSDDHADAPEGGCLADCPQKRAKPRSPRVAANPHHHQFNPSRTRGADDGAQVAIQTARDTPAIAPQQARSHRRTKGVLFAGRHAHQRMPQPHGRFRPAKGGVLDTVQCLVQPPQTEGDLDKAHLVAFPRNPQAPRHGREHVQQQRTRLDPMGAQGGDEILEGPLVIGHGQPYGLVDHRHKVRGHAARPSARRCLAWTFALGEQKARNDLALDDPPQNVGALACFACACGTDAIHTLPSRCARMHASHPTATRGRRHGHAPQSAYALCGYYTDP